MVLWFVCMSNFNSNFTFKTKPPLHNFFNSKSVGYNRPVGRIKVVYCPITKSTQIVFGDDV